MNKTSMVILLGFMVFGISNTVYGEIIHDGLGAVSDLVISENSQDLYYFELDDKMNSKTWVYDTRIIHSDGQTATPLSDSLFIYPTELNEIGNYLIFAALSEDCIGGTICDFQDIVIMSEEDGSFQKIVSGLKSAVRISVVENEAYVSESNGKIWKFSDNGKKSDLLYEGEYIIMDIAAFPEGVYWIEEIHDQNSRIMSIIDGKEAKIVADNLKIPYDLRIEGQTLHWNEISMVAIDGALAEATEIKIVDAGHVETKMLFENTSPLSKGKVSYGPYRIYDDFLFVSNNTQNNSVIHLLDLNNNTQYDIATVYDYNVEFFRNDASNLYVVGINDNGFIIERFTLPVSVPEFSSVLILLSIVTGLSLTVVSRRIFHY